jgi:hypothetical protein
MKTSVLSRYTSSPCQCGVDKRRVKDSDITAVKQERLRTPSDLPATSQHKKTINRDEIDIGLESDDNKTRRVER